MEEHRLENPSNARIFINYNKKKKVRFEYPCKKSKFSQTFHCVTRIITSRILGLSVICFLTLITIGFLIRDIRVIFPGLIILGIFLIFVITSPFISLILYRCKWFVKRIPEINKRLEGEYYYKKVEKLDKPEFEIEYFDNIFLDYRAKGEFGKYLKRVEITEYPFDIIKIGRFRKSLKERQDFIWRAKFYFSQIPKTGCLEVKYY